MEPSFLGVRHVKVWCTDLERSSEWYARVLRAVPDLDFEDEDGAVRGRSFHLPGSDTQLMLRESPDWARALKDADPFAWRVAPADLQGWVARLAELGVPHSPVVKGSGGHAMGCYDPDGIRVVFYADDPDVAEATAADDRTAHVGPRRTLDG